jgi:hypothetical protein
MWVVPFQQAMLMATSWRCGVVLLLLLLLLLLHPG